MILQHNAEWVERPYPEVVAEEEQSAAARVNARAKTIFAASFDKLRMSLTYQRITPHGSILRQAQDEAATYHITPHGEPVEPCGSILFGAAS